MGKKRKSAASRLDEVDRSVYSTFCSAANSLSHLYTQAMNHQKLSFQAGERHALETLYEWILRQYEQGSRVSSADIIAHLQNELDYGDETPIFPRIHFQQNDPPQSALHTTSSGMSNPSYILEHASNTTALHTGHSDQAKNTVYSNALSSPVRQTLQTFQFPGRDAYYPNNDLPIGNVTGISEASSTDQNLDNHPLAFDELSMDTLSDSFHKMH